MKIQVEFSNEDTSKIDSDNSNLELGESSTNTSTISILNEIDGCPEDSIHSPAKYMIHFSKNPVLIVY